MTGPGAFTAPSLILRDTIQLGPVRAPIGERRVLGEARQSGNLLNAGSPSYGDTANRDLFDRGLAPDSAPAGRMITAGDRARSRFDKIKTAHSLFLLHRMS